MSKWCWSSYMLSCANLWSKLCLYSLVLRMNRFQWCLLTRIFGLCIFLIYSVLSVRGMIQSGHPSMTSEKMHERSFVTSTHLPIIWTSTMYTLAITFHSIVSIYGLMCSQWSDLHVCTVEQFIVCYRRLLPISLAHARITLATFPSFSSILAIMALSLSVFNNTDLLYDQPAKRRPVWLVFRFSNAWWLLMDPLICCIV